jgi:hypothetical protein
MRRFRRPFLCGLALLLMAASSVSAQTAGKKPNILVIFGDDIGIPQISAYTQGLMGYRTPNIDRIADAMKRLKDLETMAPPRD